MKKTGSTGFYWALLAAALFAGGCGTSRPPSAAEIDGALTVIAQGVAAGAVAWQQYQALHDAAQEAADTAEHEPAQVPETTPAQIPASGRAVVAVLGNRQTCGYCVKLWKQPLEAAVEAELPGADVVDADKTAAPSLYALYRPPAGFAWPLARVFGKDGRLIGEFSARNLTPAAFAAKVRALCPECAEAPTGKSRDFPVRAAAVVAGLTRVDPARYGGWGGACPGSDVDAQVFALACQGAGVPVKTLIDAQATWPAVLSAVTQAFYGLERGDLMIVYVSGHGGQTAAAGDASETDGRSETLCLYDGPLVDDKVWELVLIARDRGVRVWIITDTCHSGTNYRSAHDYAAAVRGRGAADPDMLHWGGCADGKSSFGTSQGGTFTTALVDAWRSGQSYADWFAGAARRMPQGQRPTCEWTGRDFRHLPAFR